MIPLTGTIKRASQNHCLWSISELHMYGSGQRPGKKICIHLTGKASSGE